MADSTPTQSAASTSRLTPERKRQVRNFLLATTVAYMSTLVAKRAALAKRHVPTLFSHNHTPPPFNRYQDAIHAVTISSLLSCSVFAMGVTGTALVMDINSPQEFNDKMKLWLGGSQRESERAKNIDPETVKLEGEIEQLLAQGLAAFDGDKKEEKEKK
ncbi:hypothetical protein BZA70DRAFT_286901 [Myxozyma melibiosi]|uniref:Altered inheritance of mitochondria protein 11 n=1 Tax=Myxozyma melibiosi TaxID=54550 RepID=A0ABR1FCG1_9ASCO